MSDLTHPITVRYYMGTHEPITTTVGHDDLAAMQKMVGGGLIETFPLRIDGVILVCNEEGRIRSMPINWVAFGRGHEPEFICGDFFVCRVSGSDFASLTQEDIDNLGFLVYPTDSARLFVSR